MTLTAGIVVGIVGVLDLAQRARLPLDIVHASPSTVPFAVGLPSSAGIAAFWALASYARPRAIGIAATAGGRARTTFGWPAGWAVRRA